MLDGRVLGASQVEYKPFEKPPLNKKVTCARIRGTSLRLCIQCSQGLNCLQRVLSLGRSAPGEEVARRQVTVLGQFECSGSASRPCNTLMLVGVIAAGLQGLYL